MSLPNFSMEPGILTLWMGAVNTEQSCKSNVFFSLNSDFQWWLMQFIKPLGQSNTQDKDKIKLLKRKGSICFCGILEMISLIFGEIIEPTPMTVSKSAFNIGLWLQLNVKWHLFFKHDCRQAMVGALKWIMMFSVLLSFSQIVTLSSFECLKPVSSSPVYSLAVL